MSIKKLFTAFVVIFSVFPYIPTASTQPRKSSILLEERQIALILSLKKSENIYLESKRRLEHLPAKSVLAFKIPRSLLEDEISIKKLNLLTVISDYEKASKKSGQLLHRVTVLKSSKSKKKIIGTDVFINLARAASLKKLTLLDLEEPTEDEIQFSLTKIAKIEKPFNFCLSCREVPLNVFSQERKLMDISKFLFPNTIYYFVHNYAKSHQAQILVNNAVQKITYQDDNKKWRIQRTSTGWCAMNVRLAIEKTLTFFNRDGNPVNLQRKKKAKNLGLELVKHGYINLLETNYAKEIQSPYDAPVGAILVYKGGKSGHSEIRLEDGFASDYYSPKARTGTPEDGLSGRERTLTGVYIKI